MLGLPVYANWPLSLSLLLPGLDIGVFALGVLTMLCQPCQSPKAIKSWDLGLESSELCGMVNVPSPLFSFPKPIALGI